jgi:hypothetical protein
VRYGRGTGALRAGYERGASGVWAGDGKGTVGAQAGCEQGTGGVRERHGQGTVGHLGFRSVPGDLGAWGLCIYMEL